MQLALPMVASAHAGHETPLGLELIERVGTAGWLVALIVLLAVALGIRAIADRRDR